MKSEDILLKIKELKNIKSKLFSNCFLSFNTMRGKEWNTHCSEKSIIIQVNEGGENRLYFYTLDFNDFAEVVNEYSLEGTIEIVSKNRSEYEQELAQTGFFPLTHMKRVACKNIAEAIDCDIDFSELRFIDRFYFAGLDDVEDIFNLLWSTFDTRVSHLPNKEELVQMIIQKEFIIHRDYEGDIDSLLQYQTTPKSYYVNQIINNGNKQIFNNMVKYTMKEYIVSGGKYVFAWVDEKNVASLRFFEKYGIQEDGVWNTIYVRG